MSRGELSKQEGVHNRTPTRAKLRKSPDQQARVIAKKMAGRNTGGSIPNASHRTPRRKGKRSRPEPTEPINQGRHEAKCAVCSHPRREELEGDWLDWGSTSRIARDYRVSRDSIYHHAHAFGLFTKRRHNIRKALERMIEQAETVEVTAPAVVSAIQAYAKINSHGQWVDRVEGVNLNELFERMTRDELEEYAHDGTLPEWFQATVGTTGVDSQEG